MEVLTRVDRERIEALCRRDEAFWLDLESPADAEVEALGAALGLSPLAVADTRNFDQRPKLDHFGDKVLHVFFSALEVAGDPERRWRPLEHHLYVSASYVVTVRRDPWPRAATLRDEVAVDGDPSGSHLVYRILRAMCDDFDPAIAELETRIDETEVCVFERAARMDLASLYRLRQELQDLLRRVVAQRNGFAAMESAVLDLHGIESDRRDELADVRDQLVEVADELQRQHDDVTTLIQIYFNVSGDRLNRLASRLTILATFFLIATLVTGFFGQNFDWLVDSVDSERDFLVYGVGGLLVPLGVFAALVWWRRRDWL